MLSADTALPEESYQTPCKRHRQFSNFCFGQAFSQGPKRYNEDFLAVWPCIDERNGTSFFGVFDGHMGSKAASYAAENIPRLFLSDQMYPVAIESAIKNSFLRCDASFLKKAHKNGWDDGTTACILILTQEKIICANAGDSRCVLCRRGVPIPLSYDHKADLDAERKRIEKGGGLVEFGRINGELDVSRGIGDKKFKMGSDLPPEKQILSACPEVLTFDHDDDDEFIVLASDGIWCRMENEMVTRLISNSLRKHGDPQKAAQDLVDAALLLYGSPDNVSAVCIHVRGRNYVSPMCSHR